MKGGKKGSRSISYTICKLKTTKYIMKVLEYIYRWTAQSTKAIREKEIDSTSPKVKILARH